MTPQTLRAETELILFFCLTVRAQVLLLRSLDPTHLMDENRAVELLE